MDKVNEGIFWPCLVSFLAGKRHKTCTPHTVIYSSDSRVVSDTKVCRGCWTLNVSDLEEISINGKTFQVTVNDNFLTPSIPGLRPYCLVGQDTFFIFDICPACREKVQAICLRKQLQVQSDLDKLQQILPLVIAQVVYDYCHAPSFICTHCDV